MILYRPFTQQTDIIDKCAYALQKVNYNQKLK